MGALQLDTALREVDGRLTADLSRDWEIWGPNGGYVAGIALRAAGRVAPADHRPATFSCQYVRAASFETVKAEAIALRSGRHAWLINVALSQNGRVFLQAQVWTTNKSEGPRSLEAAMPEAPSPAALASLHERMPLAKFWVNIEARPLVWLAAGERHPKGAVAEGWYRYRDFEAGGEVFLDCIRPLILVDTLIWPAFQHGLGARPDYIAPSLDLTVWFHQPPGPADWLLAEARADQADSGLIHGRTRIWSEDGRLIATGGSHLLQVSRQS